MTQKNQVGKSRQGWTPDASVQFVDDVGHAWEVSAEFKVINGRMDIAVIQVQSRDGNAPISRRMLRDIPLEKLFGKVLAVESAELSRMLRKRQVPISYQGRHHSDEDLQAVADIYVAAYQARIPVQQAVADALGISVSTAAKRIMASRQRGFITSTQEGE
jgi:hypothetical protein